MLRPTTKIIEMTAASVANRQTMIKYKKKGKASNMFKTAAFSGSRSGRLT
jgi:hypothetical protein